MSSCGWDWHAGFAACGSDLCYWISGRAGAVISLLDYRLWLWAFLLSALMFGVGYYKGEHAIKVKVELRQAQADVAAITEQQNIGRYLTRVVDNAIVKKQKDDDNAKTKIDALRADVRAGAVRLSAAIDSANTPGHPAASAAETRADLLPATAGAILDIAADADSTVRDLNACIDAYNAVRDSM